MLNVQLLRNRKVQSPLAITLADQREEKFEYKP